MTELNFNSQSPKSNQTPRLNHSKSISKLLSGLHSVHEPKRTSPQNSRQKDKAAKLKYSSKMTKEITIYPNLWMRRS